MFTLEFWVGLFVGMVLFSGYDILKNMLWMERLVIQVESPETRIIVEGEYVDAKGKDDDEMCEKDTEESVDDIIAKVRKENKRKVRKVDTEQLPDIVSELGSIASKLMKDLSENPDDDVDETCEEETEESVDDVIAKVRKENKQKPFTVKAEQLPDVMHELGSMASKLMKNISENKDNDIFKLASEGGAMGNMFEKMLSGETPSQEEMDETLSKFREGMKSMFFPPSEEQEQRDSEIVLDRLQKIHNE